MTARLILALSCLLLATLAVPAQAKDYPERPVKIVVPFPPAGAVDAMARIIAPKLAEALGGQFYVENMGGAGGDIGAAAVANAPADGYTLLLTSPDIVVRPLIKANVPYDPVKSFAPITLVASSPAAIVVHPSVAAKNMQELIALLKANPGKYSVGTPGYGTLPHLEGERLYKQAHGVEVLYVPFQGYGPAVTSAVGGHILLLGAPVAAVAPLVKDGKLRALAVAAKARSPALPDVPTLEEAGIKDQDAGFAGGLLVRAGTPKEIVEQLHRQMVRILSLPDVKEKLAVLGFDPIGNTPDEFAAWIRSESAKWRAVVSATNIKID